MGILNDSFDDPGDFGKDNDLSRISGKRAVLYVKSPRKFGNTMNRPIRYNFGLEYQEKLLDEITDKMRINRDTLKTNPASHKAIAKSISQSQEGIDAIMYEPQGVMLGTAVFSEAWLFKLVIDNDTGEYEGGIQGKYSRNRANNRTVYLGYASEEPVNISNHGAGHRYNPNCLLYITHKTIGTENPLGSRRILRITSDVDFLERDTHSRITDDHLFKNIPSEILGHIEFDDPEDQTEGMVTMLGKNDSIAFSPESTHHFKTEMNSPTRQCEDITKTILKMQSIYGDEQFSGDDWSQSSVFDGDDEVNYRLTQEFKSKDSNTSVASIGIANGEISLEELINRYNIDIKVINNTFSSKMFESLDPRDVNEINIYSAMIAKTLPSIVYNAGFLDYGFNYCSNIKAKKNTASGILGRDDDVDFPTGIMGGSFYEKEPAFKLEMFTPIVKMGKKETKARATQMLSLMKDYIFDPIVARLGEIDLSVTMYGSDDIYVKLRLIDRDSSFNYSDAVYREHTCLGGINTPLLATANTIQDNALELGQLSMGIVKDNDHEIY